jgi:hypothetical protein
LNDNKEKIIDEKAQSQEKALTTKIIPVEKKTIDKEDIKEKLKQPAKKRGRPKGSTSTKKKEVKPKLPKTNEFFKTIFSLIASVFGDHWKLEKNESELIGNATDDLLEKYLPETFNYIVELTFLIAVIGIIQPRIEKEFSEEKKSNDNGQI